MLHAWVHSCMHACMHARYVHACQRESSLEVTRSHVEHASARAHSRLSDHIVKEDTKPCKGMRTTVANQAPSSALRRPEMM